MSNKALIPTSFQKYWEMKLRIDYAIELEKYKKLCGIHYKKRLLRVCFSKKSYLFSYAE